MPWDGTLEFHFLSNFMYKLTHRNLSKYITREMFQIPHESQYMQSFMYLIGYLHDGAQMSSSLRILLFILDLISTKENDLFKHRVKEKRSAKNREVLLKSRVLVDHSTIPHTKLVGNIIKVFFWIWKLIDYIWSMGSRNILLLVFLVLSLLNLWAEYTFSRQLIFLTKPLLITTSALVFLH